MQYLIPVLLLATSVVIDSSGSGSSCAEPGHLKRDYRAVTDGEYDADQHDGDDDARKSANTPAAEPPNGARDGVQQGTTVDTSLYPSSSPPQSSIQTTNPYALSQPLTGFGGFNLFPGGNSFSASPQTGSFLLGNSVVVTSSRPSDATRTHTRSRTVAGKPSATTHDFGSLLQPYSPLYSPSSQQFSFTNPGSYTFRPNYLQPGPQLNYGFGSQTFGSLPTLQSPYLQNSNANGNGDKKVASTNNANGQYHAAYPSFSAANPFTYGMPFAGAYGGNILNGNAFPLLTAQGFQAPANNLVSSATLSTPFSSGIYHSQPSYANQFLPQKQFPVVGNINKFQPQKVSITTARPHVPRVTERPVDDTSEDHEEKHRYEEDSKYKYDSDDDDDDHYRESKPSSDYRAEHQYSHHHDEDDGDSDDISSETSADSSFPAGKAFLKTSQSVGKSSYDHDQESGPDHQRSFAVEDIFKSSPKEYYSASFHSEEPYGFGKPSGSHESMERHEYRYKHKKPSGSGKKIVYGKHKSSSPYSHESGGSKLYPPRSYNTKRAAGYSDDRFALGRYGEPKYYEDSEIQHSEYRPEALSKEVTQEDKKRDYYSYSVVTHKLSE